MPDAGCMMLAVAISQPCRLLRQRDAAAAAPPERADALSIATFSFQLLAEAFQL